LECVEQKKKEEGLFSETIILGVDEMGLNYTAVEVKELIKTLAKPINNYRWLMNPHTGSVDHYEVWLEESEDWENPDDFDDLLEVKWDEEEQRWVEE
jgi:hypothetical protein